jgi:hypothetical protein
VLSLTVGVLVYIVLMRKMTGQPTPPSASSCTEFIKRIPGKPWAQTGEMAKKFGMPELARD